MSAVLWSQDMSHAEHCLSLPKAEITRRLLLIYELAIAAADRAAQAESPPGSKQAHNNVIHQDDPT